MPAQGRQVVHNGGLSMSVPEDPGPEFSQRSNHLSGWHVQPQPCLSRSTVPQKPEQVGREPGNEELSKLTCSSRRRIQTERWEEFGRKFYLLEAHHSKFCLSETAQNTVYTAQIPTWRNCPAETQAEVPFTRNEI